MCVLVFRMKVWVEVHTKWSFLVHVVWNVHTKWPFLVHVVADMYKK